MEGEKQLTSNGIIAQFVLYPTRKGELPKMEEERQAGKAHGELLLLGTAHGPLYNRRVKWLCFKMGCCSKRHRPYGKK